MSLCTPAGRNRMYSENYYWGPKRHVQQLLSSQPFFRDTPGGKLRDFKEYNWQEFMTQVAANNGRIKSFSAADMELRAVLSKKPGGKLKSREIRCIRSDKVCTDMQLASYAGRHGGCVQSEDYILRVTELSCCSSGSSIAFGGRDSILQCNHCHVQRQFT